MADDVFALSPDAADGRRVDPREGTPLVETANRTQVELTPTDVETLLPPGHAARLVWRFVDGLDLRQFYAAIGSRDTIGGRPAIDPKILVALWLYATIDGVGSAREIDRLCYSHDAYRWIRGGVSVNYHSLSSFRVRHQAALDDLLTQSITALLHRRVVTLRRVAADGTRIRANAGIRSFRRAQTLRECLAQARQLMKQTARQTDGAGLSREAAAQARAAAEQLVRVEEALAELPRVTAVKRRNRSTSEPRVSTTDPEARVMKMADGGYRPAYNVQFATDGDSDVIVGVAVINTGTDQGELVPMLNEIERRVGRVPDQTLVDGGYVNHRGIEDATCRGSELVAPVPRQRGRRDATPPQPSDSMAIALWRTRMLSAAAQDAYRIRGSIAERVNADIRAHRMHQAIPVRGLHKVHSWVLWIALAINAMRAMEIVPHLMT